MYHNSGEPASKRIKLNVEEIESAKEGNLQFISNKIKSINYYRL